MTDGYEARFRRAEDADRYDALYAHGTRDRAIWDLQRPVVQELVRRVTAHRTATRLLDFACGTGRILTAVEDIVDEADAVDASAEMVARAREASARARVVVGTLDEAGAPDELDRDYDVATAFRFFLNVDDEVRRAVLRELHKRLRARRGWLIFNNHGNTVSIRHLALKANRDPDAMRNELSDRQVRALLDDSGFAVTEVHGFGVVPDVLYRSSLSRLAQRLDAGTARRRLTRAVTIDRIYLARADPG